MYRSSKFGNWPSGPVSKLAHPSIFMPGFMGGGGGTRPFQIANSLRFRASNSARLERTFAAGSQTIWTVSMWVKRGNFVAGAQHLLSAGGNHPTPAASMGFVNGAGGEQFGFIPNNGSSAVGYIETAPVFRDPTAPIHVVVAFNSTLATASDRVKFYFNRRRVTTFNTADWPALNGTTQFNSAVQHRIGHSGWIGQYFDGNISNFTFVNAQDLPPETFAGVSAASGEWVPKQYIPPIATNNCLLEFKDAASTVTIGHDTSGNNNHWTTSGISVTAGTSFDQSTDTPTNNFATWNPLDKSSNITLSNANLTVVATSEADYWLVRAAMPIPNETDGWYWETTIIDLPYVNLSGLYNGARSVNGFSPAGSIQRQIEWGNTFGTRHQSDTGATTSWSGAPSFAAGDTIAHFYRAGKLWFGRIPSGGSTVTWINTSGTADPDTDSDPRFSGIPAGLFPGHLTPRNARHTVNFGQHPFIATNRPVGARTLCTANLPTPTILNGEDGMAVRLRTGSNSAVDVTDLRFGTNFTLLTKSRNTADNWNLADSVRGTSKNLATNSTAAEDSVSRVTAFNANGYTLAGGAGATNNAGQNFVDAAFRIGPAYGHDIVTYVGNSTLGRTVAHGLGAVPHMMIVKRRDGGGSNFGVYHRNMAATPQNGAILLSSTGAYYGDITVWNNTAPTSSVFTVGNGTLTNNSPDNYVAYLWTSIPGFSLFGSYVGNGSADGPFVWCGFKPRWVMVKRADSAGSWVIIDSARAPFNEANARLFAELADAEVTSTAVGLDLLSGGFKPRQTNANINASGGTYLFGAMAEAPFKSATGR